MELAAEHRAALDRGDEPSAVVSERSGPSGRGCGQPVRVMAKAAELCKKHNVLLVADEIQTGLGRTGKMFCSEWDGVHPDVMVLGKALGGGFYPVSAMLANDDVMGVFKPGDHGSTFGGNPFGAAVARAALAVLVDEALPQKALELGNWFMGELAKLESPHVAEVRGQGLMIGVEIKPESGSARPFCEALMQKGILAKETHEQVVRFAPPLVVEKADLEWALERVAAVLGAAQPVH